MKPRFPSTLTSPAPCGAFLCPSASPFNGYAFTPSPFGPLPLRGASLALPHCRPPRLGQARALGRQPYARARARLRGVPLALALALPVAVRPALRAWQPLCRPVITVRSVKPAPRQLCRANERRFAEYSFIIK